MPCAISTPLHIDTIIQTNLYDKSENLVIMDAAQQRHIQYCFIPGEMNFILAKYHRRLLGYPSSVSTSRRSLAGEVVKRIFDVTCVVITLPLWFAGLCAVGCVAKAAQSWPGVFTPLASTRHSKPFRMYKFRSMIPKCSGEDAVEIFRKMGRDDLVEEYNRFQSRE